jgi:hypothetical protein
MKGSFTKVTAKANDTISSSTKTVTSQVDCRKQVVQENPAATCTVAKFTIAETGTGHQPELTHIASNYEGTLT